MELLQLRYFRTVAQMESISKAAEFYHIPQPAMSQTIARLERELGGVRLFDRRNRRLYLNDNGRLFLQYVDQALGALEDGMRAVTASRQEISGPIRILAIENRRFVLSCVSAFAKLHPKVNFQISHDYYSDQDMAYDLYISASLAHRHLRENQPLIRERIILALHDRHPLAERSSVRLTELKNEKFITPSSLSSLYTITCERCRKAGFEPQIAFICDDPYFVRKYISEEMGVSLSPEVSWAGRFRENTKLIPIDDPALSTTSYLSWDVNRYLPPAVCAFRDYLLQQSRLLPGNLLAGE